VMWPVPHLILAMAQHRQGQKTQARKTLALAVSAYDWSAARADSRDIWIWTLAKRLTIPEVARSVPVFILA